jgi:hypothetical protein
MALLIRKSGIGPVRTCPESPPRLTGSRLESLCLRLPLLILSLLISLSLPVDLQADTPRAGEYQVKAAFILNFANFTDWPDDPASGRPLTIGILGRDPFEGAMDSLKGKTVKGRKVVIRHYGEPEEATGADILFIGASERRSLPHILKTLRGRPVLTIGDYPGFAHAGVMINMVLVQKRVGFEVNLQAAKQSGMRISSQLLRLAKEVIEP